MPATKRSPAQIQAKTKAAPEPALTSTAPAVRANEWPSYFEKDSMTRTHEMIVEAVTKMLTSGGHQDDVDGLIYSAMAYQRRRFFGRWDLGPDPKRTISSSGFWSQISSSGKRI